MKSRFSIDIQAKRSSRHASPAAAHNTTEQCFSPFILVDVLHNPILLPERLGGEERVVPAVLPALGHRGGYEEQGGFGFRPSSLARPRCHGGSVVAMNIVASGGLQGVSQFDKKSPLKEQRESQRRAAGRAMLASGERHKRWMCSERPRYHEHPYQHLLPPQAQGRCQ